MIQENAKPATPVQHFVLLLLGIHMGKKKTAAAKQVSAADVQVLEDVFNILDAELGDTDPIHWGDDMTDDDIKDEHPLFWACQRIGELKAKFE